MWKEKPQPIPVQIVTGYDPRIGHVLVVLVGDIEIPILMVGKN